MKLRIRGNSIRLRLLKSEVERLGSEGIVSESTRFGPGARPFVYTVKRDQNTNQVTAAYVDSELSVALPKQTANHWIESEEIGISASLDIGEDVLEILIEKDFVCKTRTDDPDQDDTYPHPDDKC